MHQIPYIPETAPFTAEQRAWLNGFLAGLYVHAPSAVPTDNEYPFVLLTGRGTSAQWHTNTRTGKSAVLRSLYPENPYAEINPEDAARLGMASSSTVRIISRRASVQCAAFLTATVKSGQIFMPMHYEIANRLPCAEFDPHSRQPSYKYCAVRLQQAG